MPNLPESARPRAGAAGKPDRAPTLFDQQRGIPQPRDADNRPDFLQIQQSSEFRELRGRLRRFVFPLTLAFFAWYLTYVLLAAYAHDFMSIKILGEINIGIVLGILQFFSTIAITTWYVRFAKKRLDPQVELIRKQAGAGPE
ncbi:uncharacterized membrane protein (DUF485 family) [Tamaricihabitans halophyticus]|uniref:Uncharacterized membrane protein (DUF485 family) n=2 Tax=Tamaricihabitans halophyticus TaxID=1262583 RepID=A0A4V2SSR9_9PSEU|nr:uncharacterized membrane protein (DUF485 family) [Tamaricihabitans halophyticus]